ncbi:uncharacterized protein LOC127103455 [Lathyrus oleraceus]|uniref:uncharacterized protein LOC127103455 n=1 Tax=Pisum sativum TaxID=3888 RepID=UPI0021CDF4C2|nr:uncharacterized protein LOC127103455 [Pisum sativum]
MSTGKRSICGYKFVEPQLKALRGLGTRLILDNKDDIKKSYDDILGILNTEVNIMSTHTLVQLYVSPMRCFTFQDYQLAPTLEEYSYITGVEIKDQVTFININDLPKFHHIVEAIHLEKKKVEINLKPKGGTHCFTLKFMIDKAITFVDAGSWNSFNVILDLLIYGILLFPNIKDIVELTSIRIFMSGNHVPTLLADTYYSIQLRNQKKKGTIVLCAPLLYICFISHFPNKGHFVENKVNLKCSQRIISLTSDDIL